MNNATIAIAMATLRYTTHIVRRFHPARCWNQRLCRRTAGGIGAGTDVTRAGREAVMRLLGGVALALGLASLAGCPSVTPPGPPPPPGPIPLSQVPGALADPLDGLADAIGRQCALARPPGDWPAWCAEFVAESQSPRAWLERRFQAQELVDAARPEGLVTGYYEPLIHGSLTRESARQAPIRARPADLLIIDLASIEPKLQGLRLRGRVDGAAP